MAWKAEVIADASGKWAGNALVFETQDEAERYVRDLMMRWFAVTDTRTVETDEKPNYRFNADGSYSRIEDEQGQTT
jgi:hypothetical protein